MMRAVRFGREATLWWPNAFRSLLARGLDPHGHGVDVCHGVTLAAGCVSVATPEPSDSAAVSGSTAEPSTSSARGGSALSVLATLAVKGRAPKTGYDRALFGQAWADVDRNGCDTRNDVLRRDLTTYVLKSGTNGCLVLSGALHDPYSGTTIAFV